MLLVSLSMFAQGTLKGKITDNASGDPLIAATVTVSGTTIGTVTNYNGEYVLPLREGTYTVLISYIGYADREETVTIADNAATELNASLGAVAFQGEEVVVTMQARGQLGAVNQQLRSNQVVNVVAAERIRELPDENAAQAISRLPGITLDGSKVVIRGIESKMNKVMINGVEMPSTEGENRATDLGMISANMLSGIEVYKTLTPDMDADAVGGVVNLRFREASSGFHYSVMAQSTYNSQEKYIGANKIWGDVSNRFLDDRLGVILNMNYESTRGGDDWYTTGYMLYVPSENYEERKYTLSNIDVYDQITTNQKIGASLVLDYDLPGGQIVYSGMFSHSTPESTTHRDAMNATGNYWQLYLDRSKNTQLLLNNSLRYEQQIGIVGLDASISQVSIDRTPEFDYNFRVASSTMDAFDNSMLIHSEMENWEPWQIYDALNHGAMENGRGHTARITPSTYGENQVLADLNLKVPLRISDNINVEFKAGGKYKRKDRHYDASYLEYYNNNVAAVNQSIAPWLISIGHDPEAIGSNLYFSDFRDYNYQTNKGYMNGNENFHMNYVMDVEIMDEMWLNQVNMGEGTLMNAKASDVQDDYWGFETLTAGYLMGEINLGKRLVIIPGVRYERAHNEYTALKVEQGSMTSFFVRDTLTKPATHENWLPHLHVRFRATDWWDVRFSYNKTLTRPDYNHAIPSVYIQPGELECSLGNPYIRPAESANLDANFTFYARKLGLITIGGFKKTISDIFYSQPTILKNLPDTTLFEELPLDTYPGLLGGQTDFFVNSPYDADLYGLEAEWQSNFSWLPGALGGLVLNVNYTRVWSETRYMQFRTERVPIPVFPYAELVQKDTFYVNRLLHQPTDIANVSLGYDYKGFSARLSFRFQGQVVRSIANSPERNGYSNDVYKYDFVVKQKIPMKFADLEVFFNAINFTNVPQRRYVAYPNLGEANTYTRYSGAQFQLGVRLRH